MSKKKKTAGPKTDFLVSVCGSQRRVLSIVDDQTLGPQIYLYPGDGAGHETTDKKILSYKFSAHPTVTHAELNALKCTIKFNGNHPSIEQFHFTDAIKKRNNFAPLFHCCYPALINEKHLSFGQLGVKVVNLADFNLVIEALTIAVFVGPISAEFDLKPNSYSNLYKCEIGGFQFIILATIIPITTTIGDVETAVTWNPAEFGEIGRVDGLREMMNGWSVDQCYEYHLDRLARVKDMLAEHLRQQPLADRYALAHLIQQARGPKNIILSHNFSAMI